MRVGTGFDVHAFEPGDHVTLGGVRIAHHSAFRAHSDGDVLLHAITDALLGAAALGDIGRHFPDTDPAWKGADSRDLLRAVVAMLAGRGLSCASVDATVIAERPKLGPHIGAMGRQPRRRPRARRGASERQGHHERAARLLRARGGHRGDGLRAARRGPPNARSDHPGTHGMSTIAIIGGTGLARMEGLIRTRREMVKTPYGAPSCPLVFGTLGGVEVVFLARHGSGARIEPHLINYCANVWALHSVGVTDVLATSVVGGIGEGCVPGAIVVPDQLIDYTSARESSFSDSAPGRPRYVDFTRPYSERLREALVRGARELDGEHGVVEGGCYAAMQGPRLETAAEVRRLERDGNTIVGLTGMPEAVLARELGLGYACCAVVVNRAAGLDGDGIASDDVERATAAGVDTARRVLTAAVGAVGSDHAK